jgi:hypothetical protein
MPRAHIKLFIPIDHGLASGQAVQSPEGTGGGKRERRETFADILARAKKAAIKA